jgi:diguanylate cyclase (GGDEF)-like protein/PAS domain S-box-containing protein
MTQGHALLAIIALLLIAIALGAAAAVFRRRLARTLADKAKIEVRYRTVVEQADEGIFIIDVRSGRILEANRALQRRLGYSEQELLSLRLDDILIETIPSLDTGALEKLTNTRSHVRTLKHRCKDGQLLDVEVTASQLDVNGSKALCYIAHDVTVRKKIQKKLLRNQRRLDYLAHHDSLTGLPNRLFLRTYLDEALLARTAHSGIAVMFLDLDHFKDINDARGHDIGDALLVDVSRQLKSYVGERGVVVRLGGDEFVVVLRDVSDPKAAAKDAAAIREMLAGSPDVTGRATGASVSIGISLCPYDAEDVVSLMRHADLAMYKAKEAGRGNVQFFRDEMNTQMRRRLAMERAMRRALKAGEFIVHYQPLVEVATRRIVSLEALVRWQHPRLGLILPGTFIPVAEESGLILPLGEHVLRSVCEQLVQWQAEGVPVVPVAVNWSTIQLQRQNVVEVVRQVLQATQADPRLLAFEITEGALMHDVTKQAGNLQALRDMGVRIQIDDFGTGYSSLSYLRQLPIDTLKIDRSFISDVDVNPADEAIVSAVFAMARSLGLRVVAEGVETSAQLEVLNRHHCEIAQGYFFSRPLSNDRCRTLLQELAIRPSFTDTLRLRMRGGVPVVEPLQKVRAWANGA